MRVASLLYIWTAIIPHSCADSRRAPDWIWLLQRGPSTWQEVLQEYRQLCWAMSRQERLKECFRARHSFRWKQRSFWGSVRRWTMKNISCNSPTICLTCEALGFNFASNTATQASKWCDSATDSLENKPYKPQILWQNTWSLEFLKL